MEKKNLVKIFFDLSGTGWPTPTESVWAEFVEENVFRIDNIPIHAYGVSYNDVISSTLKENNLFFDSVVKRGGHSTFRIFFKISDMVEDFTKNQLKSLSDLGCTYEGDGKNLYAIDVPPNVSTEEVVKILKEGENIGKWEYDEGYIHTKN